MMRGKPKSAEAISKKIISRAYYYSKKFPLVVKGNIRHGDVDIKGRKKLTIEIMQRSIPDKKIAGMLIKTFKSGLPFSKNVSKVAKYALSKFGNNKALAIQYLEGLFEHLASQSRANTEFAEKVASGKRTLNEKERQSLYERLDHVSSNVQSIIAYNIRSSIISIRSGRNLNVDWKSELE